VGKTLFPTKQLTYKFLQDDNQCFFIYLSYMRTLGIPLTKHITNHSDWKSFKFSFFCDCCNKEWISPLFLFTAGGFTAIDHEETKALIWACEHQKAFEQANLEAQFFFNNCPECNRWVCDDCFDTEWDDHYGLCKDCSERKKPRTYLFSR